MFVVETPPTEMLVQITATYPRPQETQNTLQREMGSQLSQAVFSAEPAVQPVNWLVGLIIRAGDVETNPGPPSGRICKGCNHELNRKQKIVKCNSTRGQHWVHETCASDKGEQKYAPLTYKNTKEERWDFEGFTPINHPREWDFKGFEATDPAKANHRNLF